MARIVIATFGSLGDLHPALALALGLCARGHRVEIATSEPYRAKVTALNLTFRAVRPDLSLLDTAMVRRVMDGRRGSEYLLRRVVFPAVRQAYTDLAAIAAGADLLIGTELAYVVPLIAAQQGVPWVFFGLSPISFFSVFDPPLMPGPPGLAWIQSLGPHANRLLRAIAKMASHAWWSPLRALHREHGFPAGRSPFFEGKYSSQLNLALFSPELQPLQSDWPAKAVQTGFLFHDENSTTNPLPAAIETFLAAGDPPLVFTLGSAAVDLAGDFYAQSARAAALLGRRALLLLGKNPPPSDLPPSVLAWDYLPYASIFPRAAAVVHQGGVGTTAQALRAGRPMLVMPFAHDQFDNAARVTRLGVARTVSRSRYRADRVARALGALLADQNVASKSARIGERIRAENGLAVACDALERVLNEQPHR